MWASPVLEVAELSSRGGGEASSSSGHASWSFPPSAQCAEVSLGPSILLCAWEAAVCAPWVVGEDGQDLE